MVANEHGRRDWRRGTLRVVCRLLTAVESPLLRLPVVSRCDGCVFRCLLTGAPAWRSFEDSVVVVLPLRRTLPPPPLDKILLYFAVCWFVLSSYPLLFLLVTCVYVCSFFFWCRIISDHVSCGFDRFRRRHII